MFWDTPARRATSVWLSPSSHSATISARFSSVSLGPQAPHPHPGRLPTTTPHRRSALIPAARAGAVGAPEQSGSPAPSALLCSPLVIDGATYFARRFDAVAASVCGGDTSSTVPLMAASPHIRGPTSSRAGRGDKPADRPFVSVSVGSTTRGAASPPAGDWAARDLRRAFSCSNFAGVLAPITTQTIILVDDDAAAVRG